MRARGFTLIEMAIAIVIIGVLMTALMQYLRVYQHQNTRAANLINTGQVATAVRKYYERFGFLPCPAGPNYGVGNPNRGVEVRYQTDFVPDLPAGVTPINGKKYGRCNIGPTAAPGGGGPEADPTTGIARVAGHRVDPSTRLIANQIGPPPAPYPPAYPGKNAAASAADTSVFIGAVPYVTLGLPEEYTYDAYGMKLSYAVSAPVTHNDTFTTAQTGRNITTQILDYNGGGVTKTFLNTNTSQMYLVFSSGQDKLGAYAANSTVATACPAVDEPDDAFSRRENCDGDALFIENGGVITSPVPPPVYKYGLSLNPANAAGYFDDVVMPVNSIKLGTWSPAPNTSTDVLNANNNNVGIGKIPAQAIRLDVQGNTRANAVVAKALCSTAAVSATGTAITPAENCLDPRALAGDPDVADVTTSGGFKCGQDADGRQQVLLKIGKGASAAGVTLPYTIKSTPPAGGDGAIDYVCVTPTLSMMGIVPSDDPNADASGLRCKIGYWVVGFHPGGKIKCGL